jgi:YidC/Oxa1 family membrane protein insertase
MTPPLANLLQPLIDIFEPVLVFFHDEVGFGWGTSIVALTVVVRAAILPLAVRQYRSMRRLQEVAPQMKAIQEKYKEDKQRQQQELMKFYSENKVNPFSSCLPLLLQMPVFLALFYLLRGPLREEICGQREVPCGEVAGPHDPSFFFINDLTAQATGAVLIALMVLYVGSQLGSSLLMMVSADKNQRLIMLSLPFLFVAFIWHFPAGLLVYWITTNLWTIVQQLIIRRIVGPPVKASDAKTVSPAGGRAPKTATAAVAAAGGGGDAEAVAEAPVKRSGPPPQRSRKKKKRSGRRR